MLKKKKESLYSNPQLCFILVDSEIIFCSELKDPALHIVLHQARLRLLQGGVVSLVHTCCCRHLDSSFPEKWGTLCTPDYRKPPGAPVEIPTFSILSCDWGRNISWADAFFQHLSPTSRHLPVNSLKCGPLLIRPPGCCWPAGRQALSERAVACCLCWQHVTFASVLSSEAIILL